MLEVLVDGPRPPIDLLSRVTGVVDVQSFGDRAHVRVRRGDAARASDAVAAALRDAGVPIAGIRPVAASLEDVFIDLITGKSP
jgi:hypothetical protein